MSDDTEEKVEGEVVEETITESVDTEPTDVPVEVEGATPDPEAE